MRPFKRFIKLPKNWIEKSFPGVHSDIGGSAAVGYQGKKNDIQFKTLNWMTNTANKVLSDSNKGNNIFSPTSQEHQPSAYFNYIYNEYEKAQTNYNKNPTSNNYKQLKAARSILEENYIHSESWNAPWNYDIGGQRGVYYPNDSLLREN